jgi:hypothetical protein
MESLNNNTIGHPISFLGSGRGEADVYIYTLHTAKYSVIEKNETSFLTASIVV